MSALSYNEPSWAIDLIGHLKQLVRQTNRSVKDVGGENTIRSEGGSLFPDVLLFGDREIARILQGWELKMPDTDIDDYEFRKNAETKAKALGLDSYVLWNVTIARLYTRVGESDDYAVAKEWADLADIRSRKMVVANRSRWEQLAGRILGYVNDLFDRGSLEGRQFIEMYRAGGITSLIMENSGLVAKALGDALRRDVDLRDEVVLWWDRSGREYGGKDRDSVLAQAVISNWIGKFLFAHILREKDHRARCVESIVDETTPAEALDLFQQLSEDCNFWTIFSESFGLAEVPGEPWSDLKQFNNLLLDLRLGSIHQGQLSDVLEATVDVAVRKLRGQYATPIELARLIAQLCIDNIDDDRVLDPCCGSGTIPRAMQTIKLQASVPDKHVSESVFASDLDPQAVQIATFALAVPAMMRQTLRIFRMDAFDLRPEMTIEFRNPANGEPMVERLGLFDAIAVNLPFVSQTGRGRYREAIDCVRAEFALTLSGRSDVAAYLPFALHRLLEDNGRIGVIITNSWLGTAWGDTFVDDLGKYYDLKAVITSGSGRWFRNSKVVTNILLMQKKAETIPSSGNVSFVVLKLPREEIDDDEVAQSLAAQIRRGAAHSDSMTIRSVGAKQWSQFRQVGLGGNAQFVDCDWALELPLTPLNSHFSIWRGERRGDNHLFYPRRNHGIETEYILHIAKGPKDSPQLVGSARREVFSCPRTEIELEELGHTGALNWIDRFRTIDNMKKLKKAGLLWYEMRVNKTTRLAMPVNPGNRLFTARFDPPVFADQRWICLDPQEGMNVGLCHALLNSAVGMFLTEGVGFGRGQGVLDLNKDRIEQYFQMLDPGQLNQSEANRILEAFAPLLKRDVLEVADELEQEDRQQFDDTVLDVFGSALSRHRLYESLQALMEIRQTAKS